MSENGAEPEAEVLDGPDSDLYALLAGMLKFPHLGEFDGIAIDAVEADETGLHFVLVDAESGVHQRRVTLVRAS
ncbi:hypothetical protein [Mycobacteroides abscessus]|uniref:hypothetical protein n=1 Tax=Mycobacteroides abscessus TaxID=36809 RepID=UPI000929E666|nr:hypothetical protein [Mycobacteroides abscessus]SHQ50575.1 Uncharacterised protein [Mycobacteroides abscessus subsp. abscessus]SKQ83341.1 Uncharacterised protein [Mycobacteroides abscessus subsp. massiliense]SLC49999.1 Uncharacterised protein [Mycobacteroides abscessus subsp. massiliense]